VTKKERQLIKRAIFLLHHSNEYYEGMNILAKLVGYESFEPEIKSCEIADLVLKNNQRFRIDKSK